MSFSIRATIRALLAPRHRLHCNQRRWRSIVHELECRGERRHESGAFLLGREVNGRREVIDAIYYDDLDPNAYCTGICILHADAFAKLWAECRRRGLTVVADVHVHGGSAHQSESDRTNPMVARSGHVAIIVPGFAAWPIPAGRLGIYEYRGSHEWQNRTKAETAYFYRGYWS